MKDEHTPGQLHVASTGNHQALIVDDSTGANIAVVYDKDHAPELVRRYNAFPALLEACEGLLGTLSFYFGNDDNEHTRRARAAIAQARD